MLPAALISMCWDGIAHGQSVSILSATPQSNSDIIVTARKQLDPLAGVKTDDSLTSPAIRALGADSIGDVIARVKARYGGEPFSIVINGRRLASIDAIAELPPEALERIDLLPAATEAKFGFAASERVLNLRLKPKYASMSAEGTAQITTEGGGDTQSASVRLAKIRDDNRDNLAITYRRAAGLLLAARSDANDPAARYRSLQPQSNSLTGTIGVARPLGALNLDFSGELGASDDRALTGLASTSDDPAAPLFSRLIETIQKGRTRYVRSSGTISGTGSGLFWSVLANGEAAWSQIYNGPRMRSSRETVLASRVSTRIRSYGLTANVGGGLFKLPAGMANLNGSVDIARNTIRSSYAGQDAPAPTNQYASETQRLNVNAPILARAIGFGRAIGSLSVNGSVEHQQVRRLGQATALGYGADWSPSPALSLSFSNTHRPALPSLSQLFGPTVSRPGILLYDPSLDKTVPVTILSGGDPNTRRSSLTSQAIRLTSTIGRANLSVSYTTDQTRNPLLSFGAPSLVVEQLLPSRFSRNDAGALISFDARPFSADSERTQRLSANVHIGGSTRHDQAGSNPHPSSRLQNWDFSLNYDMLLSAVVRLSSEGPLIDVLRSPLNLTASSPARHRVDLQASLGGAAFGVNMLANWTSGSTSSLIVDGSSRKTRIASLLKANLESFIQVRGGNDENSSLRLKLAIANIFNARQRIGNERNDDPGNVNPSLILDPLGRTISFSVRKGF